MIGNKYNWVTMGECLKSKLWAARNTEEGGRIMLAVLVTAMILAGAISGA